MLGTVPTALGDVAPRSLRARFSRVVALLTAFAVAMLGVVVVAPAAQAALAAGEVSVAVTSPQEALQGALFDVTITATNSSTTDDAYNTSFRLVLPAGVTLASWSPADVAKTESPRQTVPPWWCGRTSPTCSPGRRAR